MLMLFYFPEFHLLVNNIRRKFVHFKDFRLGHHQNYQMYLLDKKKKSRNYLYNKGIAKMS